MNTLRVVTPTVLATITPQEWLSGQRSFVFSVAFTDETEEIVVVYNVNSVDPETFRRLFVYADCPQEVQVVTQFDVPVKLVFPKLDWELVIPSSL